MNKRFYFVAIFCGLCLVASFAGCSREVQQRQAFTRFLQKEVIPRNSGIYIPNTAMRKKLGIYATHYDVIVEHNKTMLERVGRPLEKLQREYQDAVKPEATTKERQAAIIKYRDALQAIAEDLDKVLAATESEIVKLKQPEGLKETYTQTVEKHIRAPARILKAMIPAIMEMMSKNLELLDYIAANKGKVEIKDGMIQVDRNKDKDQSILTHLKKMQDEIHAMAQSIQEQHNEFTRQSIGK